jgi:hypothetical protein
MKRLSKVLYVGIYIVGIPLSGILNIYGMSLQNTQEDIGVWLRIVAYLIMFLVMFLWFHLYYRAWKAIQDGYARTTPGKAIGFLFIPIFNAYWMFQAIWGFAKDYNAFIARYSINVKRLSENLFLAYVISILFWIIPGVNILAALVTLLLNIPIMLRMCDAINALLDVSAKTDIPSSEITGAA